MTSLNTQRKRSDAGCGLQASSWKVAAAALEQGLIVITAGADVLRFVPPLVIEKQHVDEMIEKLEKALLSVQE